ncbi:MAG: hypothetical protein EPO29_10025 [Betaproteobacteria bacterium]|nr:MAG: hypothetical protein EPO29_10025 [Betaproteobacteria bacterium]
MLRQLLCILACAALASFPARAQDKGQSVRPEVGKPVQAAVELLKNRRGKEALAKVREAQAVPNRTAYESLIVDQVTGQAAAAAGEPGTAARALEAAAGSSAASETQRRQFLAAAAGQHYLAKEYAKSADAAGRYFKAGGSDKAMRTMYAQALYLGNNFAAAAKALAADIEAEEQSGRAPGEDQLQLLASAYHQQRDNAGYARAMEKLVTYYPKKDYWVSVLHGVVTRPGFSERLGVELARLKLETGAMRTTSEYLEAAQLALQAGFPLEATKIIDQGYAAGALGTGADAERHRRLKDLAAKNLAEDAKSLAQDDAGAARDGKSLFNDGYNYVLHGKSAKGLTMMEQGLKLASGFQRPDHARLQLAHAYRLAGQKHKAIQVYKTVQGNDGAASIARLWIIRLGRNGGA